MVKNYRIQNANAPKEQLGDIASFLRMSLDSHKIITLFTNDLDPNQFTCGIVAALSETGVVFSRIDLYGSNDGIACLPVDIIYRVEADTPLIQRVATLWKLNGEENTVYESSGNELLRGFLKQAYSAQKVVSMEIMDSRRYDVCGLIGNLDETFVNVNLLDGNGNPMGASLVLIESITQVVMDAKEEHTIQRLYEYQKRVGNLT